jgi:uncharacterized protein (DUF2267 family)
MDHSASEDLDRGIQITGAMIDELDRRLGWNDKPRCYRLLMAVLYATWECSSADVPVRRCGTHYERWQVSASRPGSLSASDFFARVDLSFKPDPLRSPAASVSSVFDLLSENVSVARVDEMCRGLPAEPTPPMISLAARPRSSKPAIGYIAKKEGALPRTCLLDTTRRSESLDPVKCALLERLLAEEVEKEWAARRSAAYPASRSGYCVPEGHTIRSSGPRN